MRTIMTASVLALAAFTWTAAAGAQQSAPRQDTKSSGMDNRLEDYILVRLAEREWVGGDFTVRVDDGTATLGGTVPSEGTKARIGRIARQTAGIREVQNNLRVNPHVADAGTQVNDATLEQQVARRIASQIPGTKSGEDWWLEGWRVEGSRQHLELRGRGRERPGLSRRRCATVVDHPPGGRRGPSNVGRPERPQ